MLLPIVERAIKSKGSKSKVIFIHTMGSHNSFCARVWKEVQILEVDKRDQCYYNSIQNSYLLLEELMKMAAGECPELRWSLFIGPRPVKFKKAPYYIHGAEVYFHLKR